MRMLLSMARCASTFLAALGAVITSCRSVATASLSLSLSLSLSPSLSLSSPQRQLAKSDLSQTAPRGWAWRSASRWASSWLEAVCLREGQR